MLFSLLWLSVRGGVHGPDDSSLDPSVHLCWGDLAVDNPVNPAVLSVTLKASKTEITLYIGHAASVLCPVSAVLAYLTIRGKRPGPLFVFKDSKPLTRQRLVSAVRDALERARVEADRYAGHSFQIGPATTAASRGLEDSTIQMLGDGVVWPTWNTFGSQDISWPVTQLDCVDGPQFGLMGHIFVFIPVCLFRPVLS